MVLGNFLLDYAYLVCGRLLDVVSTRVLFKSRDAIELNEGMREDMVNYSLDTTLIKNFLGSTVFDAAVLGSAYGVDSLLGMENNMLNFHNLYTYGFMGPFSYLAAANNLAWAFGFDKLGNVLSKPLLLRYVAIEFSMYKLIDAFDKL